MLPLQFYPKDQELCKIHTQNLCLLAFIFLLSVRVNLFSANPSKPFRFHFVRLYYIFPPLYNLSRCFYKSIKQYHDFPQRFMAPSIPFHHITHTNSCAYSNDERAQLTHLFVELESSTWNAYPEFKSIISNWMHTNRPTYIA